MNYDKATLDVIGVLPEDDIASLEQKVMTDLIEASIQGANEIDNITVSQHGVEYDGNPKAQHNMSAVGTLANWKFNKSLGLLMIQASDNPQLSDTSKEVVKLIGGAITSIYDAIYVEHKLKWKGADDKLHTVQGESVLEALEKSMYEVGKVVSKK